MLSNISQWVVLILGITVLLFSIWGAINPPRLMTLVVSALDRQWGFVFGVVVRLILGVALIFAAPNSSFPTIFVVLGWIAILAAVALVFIGRNRIRGLIAWFEQLPPSMLRLWLLFGMAFGGFLVYGSL